jgi:hypothetical protein
MPARTPPARLNRAVFTERLGEAGNSELGDETKADPMRLSLKEGSCNMSSRFFYVELKFTPRIRTNRLTRQHKAVVEVPKDLVQRKQSEIISAHPRRRQSPLILRGELPSAHSRPLRSGLSGCTMKMQFGMRTALGSWTSDRAITKKMAPRRGGSFRASLASERQCRNVCRTVVGPRAEKRLWFRPRLRRGARHRRQI